MAQKKITNISSGIYSREVDLTIVQQNAGTFAGACLGLMERGPAFQIMTSANFDERTVRMGGLNPAYKSSYAAYEFLEQANNYKEVRILGLEGYNEDYQDGGIAGNIGGYNKAFAIMYDNATSASAGTVLPITNISTDGTNIIKITAAINTSAPNFVNGDMVTIDADLTGVTDATGTFVVTITATDPSISVTFTIKAANSSNQIYIGGGTIKARVPLKADSKTVACILKPRRTGFTNYAEVDYVLIDTALQADGSNSTATDDAMTLIVYFRGDQTSYPPLSVKCSLRPESNQYIVKLFGNDPRGITKIQGQTAPLWVEFIWPSVQHRSTLGDELKYYYPGDSLPLSVLKLKTGNVTISDLFSYPPFSIFGVVTGATTTFTTTTDHGFSIGDPITLSDITGVAIGTLNVNGNWFVATVPSSNTFTIKDAAGVEPATSGAYSGTNGTVKKTFTATWEKEVMSLGGKGKEVEFQTPITPWFVSDFDENGETKRLFRVWEISDGESANTEIKLEISNINPDGNIGYGSFDLLVRKFDDTDDKERVIYEVFSNLTMNPTSDNYILRRIGDGENFELQSNFIFIELYTDDDIDPRSLPYGTEGYPNVNGIKVPDLEFADKYDLTKPITRQYLGLANNNINMLVPVTPDNLSFKNLISYTAAEGIGFHLNPQMITATSNPILYTLLITKYKLVDNTAYQVSSTNTLPVTGLNKVKRMKFVSCFFGGFDGFNWYSARTWADTTSKDYEAYIQGLEVLNDKESLEADFSVLITPDIDFENHASAAEATLNMVENDRSDALYIFDFNYGYFTGSAVEIIPDNAKIALNSSNMKSSFATCYYPDWQFEDLINNVNSWVPPSILALATIAATATNENVFQPPAGSLRTVTQNLVRTRKRMKINDREILKSANINPITVFPGSGYEITESRTTQEVFSARSFVHNRLLLGYAKKALNQSLRPILQQLNTGKALKDLMLDAIEPIFSRIKRQNGLEDFNIQITDDENDRTTIYGKIEIVPLYPVERILLDFILRNGSISFNQ